jgi:hypothetical protein
MEKLASHMEDKIKAQDEDFLNRLAKKWFVYNGLILLLKFNLTYLPRQASTYENEHASTDLLTSPTPSFLQQT